MNLPGATRSSVNNNGLKRHCCSLLSSIPSEKKQRSPAAGHNRIVFASVSGGIAAATKDQLDTVDTAKAICKSYERTCVFVTSLQMFEERDLQKSTCNWECSRRHQF